MADSSGYRHVRAEGLGGLKNRGCNERRTLHRATTQWCNALRLSTPYVGRMATYTVQPA